MSAEAVTKQVQAFMQCRLDYCNSLFYGITKGLMALQRSGWRWCGPFNGKKDNAASSPGDSSTCLQDLSLLVCLSKPG